MTFSSSSLPRLRKESRARETAEKKRMNKEKAKYRMREKRGTGAKSHPFASSIRLDLFEDLEPDANEDLKASCFSTNTIKPDSVHRR